MSLFAFNPEDLPDVPTRKALIAIDLQNDFLAEDGALPVKQPEGMVDRITQLADAVRNSGYGEVIWVRSLFDTSRPVGDQQIMAADTPQLPARPGQAAVTAAARRQRTAESDSAGAVLAADPEAFLSVAENQTKPECVRRGTTGVELLPAFARAKGPGDYAMTKSYYSAFHSGQLLNLLRRQFATELYICGSLSNVSVYATALAASSHGFDITIVEDCCGYRSEMRHMNAARSLMDQTGCHFANAADVIPTLRPQSPTKAASANASASASSKKRFSPPSAGPSAISPEMMAAAIAETKIKQAGLPVRPKPAPPPPPLNPIASSKEEEATRLKLSQPEPPFTAGEPSHVFECAVQKAATTTHDEDDDDDGGTVQSQGESRQSKAEQAVQPVVKPVIIPRAGSGPSRSGTASKVQSKRASAMPGPMDSIVSAELLMAPTPEHILQALRDNRPNRVDGPKAPILQPLPPTTTTCHPTIPSSDPKAATMATNPLSIVSKPLCEGDTTLTENFLPPPLIDGLFERLCEEVHFKRMSHLGGEVPRFVAVQGHVDADGTQPVYRHPSDESPPLEAFTPTVEMIRHHVEKALHHPVNHVLIQCYRDGNDYISEHSDKTLDIFRWSYIANYSIGAQRTMVFRTKKKQKPDGNNATAAAISMRQTIRCPMPHNSLLKMGLVTNEKWLHGIKPDKRPVSEKSPAELAWRGTRISLTFRYIGTFLLPGGEEEENKKEQQPMPPLSPPLLIWGQGATAKAHAHAQPVAVHSATVQKLLRAFGTENHSPEFDWEAHYGGGFDVLHMRAAVPQLCCASGDDDNNNVEDGRVRVMLGEVGVKHTITTTSGNNKAGSSVRFEVDEQTVVEGDVAILLYLDARHPKKRSGGEAEVARVYTRLQAAVALGQRWRQRQQQEKKTEEEEAALRALLGPFEGWAMELAAAEMMIAGGAESSVADCALWPVLHEIAVSFAEKLGGGKLQTQTVFGRWGLKGLDRYYRVWAKRESVVRVYGEGVVDAVCGGEHEESGEDKE